MQQSFDPFSDCLGISATNDKFLEEEYNQKNSRWFLAAIAVLSEVAYIYDVFVNSGSGGSSGNNTEVLNKLFGSLDKISAQLDDINYNIELLLNMMSRLPLIVRGEIENALTKQTLGEAKGIVSLIQDGIRPAYVSTSLVKLERYCDDLQVKLSGISGLRGLTGTIIIAPYLASWLGARVAVEKVSKENNPQHTINSPWHRGFMKEMKALLEDFITQAEAQDAEYTRNVIPRFPPHGKSLVLSGGGFQALPGPVLPPPSLPYLPPKPQEYRLTCPSKTGKLEVLQYKGGPGEPGVVYPGGEVWTNVSPKTTPYDAWLRLREKREEVIQFYSAVPQFHNMRMEILSVFVEPKDVWS